MSERNNPGVFENAAGIDELSSAKLSKEIDGVEVMINQLVRISIAIHRSGARARLERADQSFQANRHSELRDHLALLISANTLTQEEKEAGNSSLDLDSKSLTDIQLRLIDANLRRRHRFLYAQRRLRKQEEDDARQHVEPRQKQAQTALANKASHEHPSPNSREEGKPGALSKSEKDRSAPLTETNSALTALDGPIEMPMDGQLSTMVPSSTSAKVVYPQISKNPGAELFTCPCCCQSLPIYISSGPKWRYANSILGRMICVNKLTSFIEDICQKISLHIRAFYRIVLGLNSSTPAAKIGWIICIMTMKVLHTGCVLLVLTHQNSLRKKNSSAISRINTVILCLRIKFRCLCPIVLAQHRSRFLRARYVLPCLQGTIH